MSELAFAGGVFTAAVIVVVVVTVAEVVARAGGCDVEAKCWLVADAAALVMSTEAADEDDRDETCCESFLAGGGSAAAAVAGETISGKTLQDVVSDAESTWTGRGEGETGEGAGDALEAGVVPSMFDSVVFTLVETEDLESGGALASAGAAGVSFTLGGDAVVAAGSGGAVELGAVGGTAGTETQEAEGAWDWAGRGGATPGGAAAN